MLHPDLPQAAPAFSIVIPVYNEADSLPELLANIAQALTSFDSNYEVIFVDDGSNDGSFERLVAFSESDPCIRVFSFRRNLGRSPALLCGIQKAVDGVMRPVKSFGRIRRAMSGGAPRADRGEPL